MFFGTWKLGAILLSMSVLYGDEGIRHRIKDSQAKVLVTDADNADRIDRDLVEHVIVLDDRLLADASTNAATVDTAADDPAQLYYSSGTTGLAKGILHAHRYLLAHEEFVYCHDVRDGELFHGMGEWAWAAGIAPLLGPVAAGRDAVRVPARGRLRPRAAARGAVQAPADERLHDPDRDAGDDGRSRTPARATRRSSASSARRASRSTRRRSAGSATSTGSRCSTSTGSPSPIRWCANYPFMEVREGSMGRPMPGWDVQILDEDEQPVAAGERGEICLRARSNPHYPLGYWNRPEDSEETFGGDWFHTKDAAEQDADGYYWYAGRADDVIISAGYRIGPFEVESACIEHPAVREAAAVASPDERRGNVVKAFVVLAEGHAPSDELADEIKRFVRDRHSAYAYPRRIEFVDDLPKTLTGKIRRIELRERERTGG